MFFNIVDSLIQGAKVFLQQAAVKTEYKPYLDVEFKEITQIPFEGDPRKMPGFLLQYCRDQNNTGYEATPTLYVKFKLTNGRAKPITGISFNFYRMGGTIKRGYLRKNKVLKPVRFFKKDINLLSVLAGQKSKTKSKSFVFANASKQGQAEYIELENRHMIPNTLFENLDWILVFTYKNTLDKEYCTLFKPYPSNIIGTNILEIKPIGTFKANRKKENGWPLKTKIETFFKETN